MTGAYIQAAAALAFVIILIAGAGHVMKKKQNKAGLMKIVGYHPFGPRKGVAAMKIGREILILGVSQNDMRLLKTFREDEVELDGTGGFPGKLQGMLGAGSHKNVS